METILFTSKPIREIPIAKAPRYTKTIGSSRIAEKKLRDLLKSVNFKKSVTRSSFTPPIAEIIWVKNVRAIVVCGFLMK